MASSHGQERFQVDPAADAFPHPPRRYRLPEGAVDTHAHVIGSAYIDERSYTPRPAPESAYLRMLEATGLARGVLVQVSVHGTDNSLMLRTLQAHRERLRGIAVIRPDLPDAELHRLQEAGVAGLRLNTTTGGGVGIADLGRYEALCAELGWHLQFLVEPGQLMSLAAKMARLRVPAVFDHMGYVNAGPGMEEGARALLQMVRDGAWVKLSGGFRLSRAGPPYADTVPLAQALAEAAPERCVWGSDWPHVSFRGTMPNTGDLLDLLADWVPDPRAREAVLVHNPQRLYGFKD
ncbi:MULTISPECIES: amidohydrolase family protein [unclassified Variovorax]|uniref:amidohydrolase family protein n=1 Tax=unclassified Variovorax TaxID=663243 RepID=UPI003F4802AE